MTLRELIADCPSGEIEIGAFQGGMMVASATSENHDAALREAMHYAMQYAQDGPVEVKVVPALAAMEE